MRFHLTVTPKRELPLFSPISWHANANGTMLASVFRREVDPMSKSKKRKDSTAVSNLNPGDIPENESAPESGDGWRRPPADRPLSMEEFAERAAALQRELRSSIDSTKIIRAHRDGCCCELDECSSK